MTPELLALGPVDGRYKKVTQKLERIASEYGLIRYRVQVECAYLKALAEEVDIPFELSEDEKSIVQKICDNFEAADAVLVKQIETDGLPAKDGRDALPATRHDVKAVEYFIKEKIKGTALEAKAEWVHFGLTSEDVNNIAYALMLRDGAAVLLATLEEVVAHLENLSAESETLPMLARTHGQPASPTTFGKEVCVFEKRIERQMNQISAMRIQAKLNGASGNYNALVAAYSYVDWVAFSTRFINSFNAGKGIALEPNLYTTQIESHDSYVELFQAFTRVNSILIGLDQDFWRYISDGWLTQKAKAGEVGSSTMPHKVNPIDFENSEGNLGVANALFNFFAAKLPIARLQRDLSDSTVERNFGVAFAHSLVAYESLKRGLASVSPNGEAMKAALNDHPEVLAEAIQTVLRREGATGAYEKLKDLTRGKKVTLNDLQVFISNLHIADGVKTELLKLTPENYIGLAAKLAKG